MVLFLVHLASTLASNTYIIIVFEKLFPKVKRPLPLKIVILAAVSVVMALVTDPDRPLLNFTISFTYYLLLAIMFSKKPTFRLAVYVVIFMVAMAIIEMLTAILFGFITKTPPDMIYYDIYPYLTYTVLSWIIMLAILKSILTIISEKSLNNVRSQELVMFLLLITGEIILLAVLNDYFLKSASSYEESAYETIVILIIFFAFDLYLTYLLRKLSKSYRMEKQLDLVTQQSQLQLNAYRELNEKYNASRSVIHDVKKHLASLEGLINANQAEEAQHYKQLLNAELDKLMPRFECDNAILSVVINNKLEAADKLNINFTVDAEYTQIDFISNLDITAIFSNLLDNAFEACSELDEGERSVSLSLKRHNHFVFILLENSFSKVDTDSEDHYRSTKKGHQGIGMSNITSACEKYSGSFNAHTEGSQFITEVLIPIPENQL